MTDPGLAGRRSASSLLNPLWPSKFDSFKTFVSFVVKSLPPLTKKPPRMEALHLMTDEGLEPSTH